ncbi:MAG: hypothetical protein RSB78_00895 [Oscillospiraceae bacterium]
MAEKKKAPINRRIISADEAKKASSKTAATAVAEIPNATQGTAKKIENNSGGGKSATGLRVGAFVLWAVAILFEIAAILLLNRTLSLPGNLTTWLIVAIAVDLVCVIIGSQLWKKSNRIDPASEKNKIKFWLWNNLGVIVAVIAFFPLVILLLRDKELDGKTKKIVTIIAAVALLIAGGSSYDFDPVSQEDQEAMKASAVETMGSADGTVYWTPFGKSYHMDPNCSTLSRSATLVSGTLDEAFDAKRFDPCDLCAGGKEAKAQTTAETPAEVPAATDEVVPEEEKAA